jgi:hydroxymethylpyrimidine/phosphomethylpyrimidine kinase
MPRDSRPCALAIGGVDPGGGAGIAADLRAFEAAGAFGCAVAAVVTVQSTRGLKRVHPVDTRLVKAQAGEVLAHQDVRAAKVGALGSAANVRAVARLFDRDGAGPVPLVVDTPIRPTRSSRAGARLTAEGALAALRRELLPRATLVTVNLAEAETLLGRRVRTSRDAREAAVDLAGSGPFAALVKGGHLWGPVATDFLAVGADIIELSARRLAAGPVHGTGCTFASLVAGRLAVRTGATVSARTLIAAVRWAKKTHHAALARAVRVGSGMKVLVF